jgi:hypothetical protein
VTKNNVARFHPEARGGMARRGAPDKQRSETIRETVEVECPECDAVLCLDAAVLALNPEVLCAGCDATIPLALAR